MHIEEYIDRHLAERDLSPATIADTFGVHIRTIHTVYSDESEIVAAHIRTRRVLRAQALLAARDEPPHVTTLAARVGLTPSQFTRPFRASTNQTTRQWWNEHRKPTH